MTSLTANRPTAEQLREYGQLRPNNHELWKYLQRRVLEPVSLKVIADELKLDEPALVVWMLTYTGPKRKPYQHKNGTPVGKVRPHMPTALATRERESAPVNDKPAGRPF
jgi:hypothetical protein